MYCNKCGKEIKINDKFCENCGSSNEHLKNKTTTNNNQSVIDQNDYDKKANKLCAYSMICTAGIPFVLLYIPAYIIKISAKLDNLITTLIILSGLTGIILAIYARVKYPKNDISRWLIWIYAVLVVCGIVSLIILVVYCNAMINGPLCDNSN